MEFGVCSDKSKAFIRLDPRSKLLLLMAISIIMIGGTTVGIEGVLRIICAAIPFLLLLSIRQYKAATIYLLLLGTALFCEKQVAPYTHGMCNIIIMMICGLITRFVAGYMMGWYTVKSTSVSEFITAMEHMHCPSFISIPISVMFRYFPTLSEEYKSINDAKRMRELGHPLKQPLTYVEYILVPLMMSTVRIADELSAASLSKGLSAGEKRTHICEIGIGPVDIVAIIGSITMFVLFLVY